MLADGVCCVNMCVCVCQHRGDKDIGGRGGGHRDSGKTKEVEEDVKCSEGRPRKTSRPVTGGAEWSGEDTRGAVWSREDTGVADWSGVDTRGAEWRGEDTGGAEWRG